MAVEKRIFADAARALVDSIDALRDPDGDFPCIPEGPERDELDQAARRFAELWAKATPVVDMSEESVRHVMQRHDYTWPDANLAATIREAYDLGMLAGLFSRG